MQELNIVHDWSNGIMTLSPLEGFNIFYDMHLQQIIKGEKEKESSSYNNERERESLSSDESSSDWEESTSYVVSEDEAEGELKKKALSPWRRKRR